MATVAKKDAILEAARAEFSAHGYAGGRVERIASAAGANKQLIFHYFGSKEGLFGTLVAARASGVDLSRISTLTPPSAIREAASTVVGWALREPGDARLVLECLSSESVPAPASSAASEWLDSIASVIIAVVADGQRKGFFRDDADPQLVVRTIVGSALSASIPSLQSGLDSQSTQHSADIGQLLVDYCAWK